MVQWARGSARAAAVPADALSSRGEMRLAYTALHAEFEAFFDSKLEKFCLDAGATAEQVHGGEAAVAKKPGFYRGVDALVTARRGLTLGIYVADCAAVYLADKNGRAIGLVHSGRAGTEANITGRAIGLMCAEFGLDPADLVVQISPCIRPPLYETDFAKEIALQARAAGAEEILDDGICTGRDLAHYYSYRIERGRTGRMLAVLSLS